MPVLDAVLQQTLPGSIMEGVTVCPVHRSFSRGCEVGGLILVLNLLWWWANHCSSCSLQTVELF